MEKSQDIIGNDELKRFLLCEVIILCPSVKEETSEREKLQILYRIWKRMNKLLTFVVYFVKGFRK